MSHTAKQIDADLKNKTIKEKILKHLPTLRNCDNWQLVHEIGAINHKMKYGTFKGGLVKYKDVYYYLDQSTMNSLTAYRKWDFPTELKVDTTVPND